MQGFSITWPRPWQDGQVRSRVKKPCAWRILPWPPQVVQTFGLVPDWAPLPGAGLAGDRGRDPDLGVLAGEGLFEGELHVVAQVRAALAAGAARAAPPGAAAHSEEVVEDVGEGGGEIGAEAGPAAAALLEGGMAEAVIGGALVAVLEDLVGLVDFLEAMLAFAVAGIA